MTSLDVRTDVGAGARTLFVSSRETTLLEYFRVPYEIDARLGSDGLQQIRPSSGGPALLWRAPTDGVTTPALVSDGDEIPGIRIFAKVLPDAVATGLLPERDHGWRRTRALTDLEGRELGSIWRSDEGSVFLPFDPDEVILNYWSERYLMVGDAARTRRLRRVAMVTYYRLRPLLPRRLQIWLRRQFVKRQIRSTFPRWPVETCLHDFFDLMFAILAGVAGEPIPRIAAWPGGHEWAFVLTHDIERADGLEVLAPVLDMEQKHGLRSSCNLVGGDYEVRDEDVRKLIEGGFEVGVHGMHHDGRDFESAATWRERLPGVRKAAYRWGAVGYRAPALHRRWDWMPLLGFEYDSSSPDTDPFEPQDGGCCTWLPFFNRELVELPLTLPHDHTVFVILCHQDETAWVEKTEFLRRRGGLALLCTHPDYLVDPRIFSAYTRFVDRFASDARAWKALPREVSSWWRRRAASSLERDGNAWRIVGPAADEGRVESVEGTW